MKIQLQPRVNSHPAFQQALVHVDGIKVDGLGLVHGAQFREHESTFEVLRSFGKVFFFGRPVSSCRRNERGWMVACTL